MEQNENRPNVILISIDTLRADHIHGYGYERETTPVIDGLMRQGTSFLTAISPSPWTLPAHISLFTSLYPHTHGVTEDTLGLNKKVQTLPMLLKDAGYATAGFAACEYLAAFRGFGSGFDVYQKENGIAAEAVCEEALKWLIKTGPKPFFLFLHLYDTHADYDPEQRYLKMFESSYEGNIDGSIMTLLYVRDGKIQLSDKDVRHLIALYDGEIRQLDHKLGVFFDFLRKRGMLSNTMLIITADHGEEFREHGGVLHSKTLYDEVIKVPLIILGPGIPPGKTIRQQVQLIDIAPTILSLCGTEIPEEMQGASLLPLIQHDEAEWPQVAFAEADKDNEEHNIKRAIRTERYKLYYDRRSKRQELYDIISDPMETTDIADKQLQTASTLREKLDVWMSTRPGNPTRIQLSEEARQELRSLGYLH